MKTVSFFPSRTMTLYMARLFLVRTFAILAAQLRTAPPVMVMVLAAFWALVPGALSFESLSEAATGGTADVTTLGTTVAAVFSIALGTLVSWSVLNTIASRRAGWADPDDN